jgi:hypothetical protein
MIYPAVNPVPAGFAIYIRVRNAQDGQEPSFFMPKVDARRAFTQQRNSAKARGISWELTFEQWVEWWGEDLPRRGRGRHNLQMQRPCDSGPYALGNIRKGTPRENQRTKAAMYPKPGAVTRIYDRVQQQEDEPDLGYASVWRLYG